MKKQRSREERKADQNQRYEDMELLTDHNASKCFHQPAYRVHAKLEERITVRELIEYLFDQVNAQKLRVNDPVPRDVIERIRQEHKTMAEYLAERYKIGGDTVGQKDVETVPGAATGAGTE